MMNSNRYFTVIWYFTNITHQHASSLISDQEASKKTDFGVGHMQYVFTHAHIYIIYTCVCIYIYVCRYICIHIVVYVCLCNSMYLNMPQ